MKDRSSLRALARPSSCRRSAVAHRVVLAVAALSLGGVTAAPALGGDSPPQRPTIPLDREHTRAAMERGKARADERRTAAAKERRDRSRTAHRGLGRAAALRLARDRHGALLDRPLGRQLKLREGQRLVRFLSATSALVDVGDRTSVVTSAVPFAVPDGDADGFDAADLDLVPTGSGFAPRRPLVPVRVARHAGATAAIGGGGLAVTPLVGAAATEAALDDGRAFWANARTDTDVLAMPVPGGLEVAYMLRSPEAPEALTLGLTLPDGATARRSTAGAGGVQVVKDGKTLATVSKPVAVDASGHPVDVSFTLQGGDLAMQVDHRGADLEYPIAVDPAVELEQEWQGAHQSKEGWWTGNINGWWNYASWDVGAGDGLNTWHDAGYFWPWWRGDWARTTPGNSFIDALNVRSIQWWLSQSCIFIGLSRHAGGAYPWLARYEDCRGENWTVNNGYFYGVGPMYPSERVEDKNYVSLVHHTGGYPEGHRGFHLTHWGNVEIWYSDWTGPAVSGTFPGWVDPAKSASNWTVRGTDAGVGVKRIEVNGDWAAGVEHNSVHGCSGNFDNLCNTTRIDSGPDYKPDGQHSVSGNLNSVPEGNWPVHGLSHDLVNHNSGWRLVGHAKVDRSGPTVGVPTGALYDRRNQPADHRSEGLYDASYSATLTASDGSTSSAGAQRSGVKTIDVKVKNAAGTVVLDSPDPAPQGCANGNCTKSRPFTLNTDSLADGDYTIEVSATDQLNHPAATPRTWAVTIDRRGDIYTAREHNRNPADRGVTLATERHKLGTTLARHEEDGFVATRRVTACSQDAAKQCGEVRELSTGDDRGESSSQHLLITKGTSVNDERLDEVAGIRDPATESLGAPETTGSLASVLEPWQQPPPANNGTYERQDVDETANVDDADRQVTRRLYLDAATKLPVREVVAVNGEVERELFYTYDKSRLTDAEVPANTWAVERTGDGTTETQDYATNPPQEPADDPNDGNQASASEASEFRTANGLDASAAHVAATRDRAANANYDRSVAEYGIPLTVAEQAELDERDRAIQAVRTTIDVYGRTQAAASYGGTWIDQRNGGLIRVSFTENADQHLQNVRAQFPYPNRLRASTVSANLETLAQVRASVEADIGTLEMELIKINSVYEDIADNTVKVGVDQPNPIVEQTLRLRYGPEISLEQQSAFKNDQNPVGSDLRVRRRIPPVYGGLKIYSRDGGCSSGFSMIDLKKRRRVLTAAHCTTSLNRTYLHAGRRVGQTSAAALGNYPDPQRGGQVGIDAQQIRVRSGYITSRVYVHPGEKNAYRIMRRMAGVGENPRGETICTVGYRRTPPRCGELISTQATVRGPEGLFYRFGLWRFTGLRTLGGDSGGAVYRGNVAFGVHKGLDVNNPSNRAIFTPMPNISRYFGTVVVTPNSLLAVEAAG